MKKLLTTGAFIITSALSGFAHANDINPQLQAKLDEANYLYESGRYREALDIVHWLDEKGVAIDHDFYPVRLGTLLPLWKRLSSSYNPARTSYNSKLKVTIFDTFNNPQNCTSYDDTQVMLDINGSYDEFITLLENKEVDYPRVWQRCWDQASTLAAVEHASKLLIESYLVDLSDHFDSYFVPLIDGLYLQCSDYDGDEETECQDGVKDYLLGISLSYQNAAMIHYGLSEAGSIGGSTLKLLLKWQNVEL
ncbi:hypothetical protein [Pseudoalteromonas sp. PS5]|uniref:hypothetical protein n=1 Tax=Pseudoalteromonas sp. PS5 TaxID=1437473 RepID=UPI000FFF22E5|nr:hypothetical protein [Pseudoalteromonas sp. PS5]RXE98409.1 hypothetical protein D9603_17160 [Pseudoalteromonas sp. PS5]